MRQALVTLISFALLAIANLNSSSALAQDEKIEGALPSSWSEQVEWRSIGPANMMGRITSIAVYEKDKHTWWAASASGGLIKTTNNGITFEHQFDDQRTVSIGDVQVSKTDPNLVWVGTGEANPRNSVSWGDGVYKSTDGGKTWKNMGLKKTFQTGRIAIHPTEHDIVYVGSLGRLWGPNEERGLFKTTDGGKTWKKIFYVDDKTGVIDVQMNPENPDELLIATYERQRDGFDGNDPMKKYGAGSAIYKTSDAGETFTRLSNGLPSCKLGRIGLCYFVSDPNYVAAIIESEKIAKEPETAAYAGLRGENADVGAKITQVTDKGPAQKAGLKQDDIVVSIDGEIVYSYNDLLKGIRKRKAGETTKLVVSRDRKPVDVSIELAKRPTPGNNQRRRRNRRSAFTGTLGGQAANLQGQQGDNEQEYGGVYLSDDGGSTWKRINTLNPRPMYYSQIRIDPKNMENMYVLGTSLYRSKDGGKTFTGDGGRGIHPDNHALWIDPDDPRHMILGNDGGIYVTYDRMDNWDHHNHAALGQFYHVGINSRLDYHVFGGLQDNGSWGGPARVSNDSGPVNTDWYRVGGGDGFITLADPEDPDQIYFESQNGAMGRIHLKTGERGFIRPRPPRGTRYRFNWKTPFTLSPHNSRIHYSAGNHVFRSFDKGNGVKAISPEITNTDKGAGSAITESPVNPGTLYVGTTDGAVWMTPDGGNEWVALYSQKEKKSKDDKPSDENAEATDDSEMEKDKPATEKSESQGESPKSETSSLNGTWNGKMISDQFPAGRAPTLTFTLKSDDKGTVTGEIETRRSASEITSGNYDPQSGKLTIVVETERGRREYEATVKGKTMTGEMSARDGQFTVQFEAEKQEDPGKVLPNSTIPIVAPVSFLTTVGDGQRDDDPLSGVWSGSVKSDQLPGGEVTFTITIEMDSEKAIKGLIESDRGEFEIEDGSYNADKKNLYFTAENEQVYLDFEAKLDGKTMIGDVTVNDQFTADFEAKQTKRASQQPGKNESTENAPKQDESGPEQTERQPGFLGVQFANQRGNSNALQVANIIEGSGAEKAGLKSGDVVTAIDGTTIENPNQLIQILRSKFEGDTIELKLNRDAETITATATLGKRPQTQQRLPRRTGRNQRPPMDNEQPAADSKPAEQPNATETAVKDDKISGTWEGMMTSNQGDRDIKFVLKQESPKKITGSFETSRGEREISEGSYNAEAKTLTLLSDNDDFSIEFNGTLSGDSYSGELDFNGGAFTMEFDVKKVGGPETANAVAAKAETEEKKKAAGNSLKELLPGPRWVSSLHASKYKAERCYASFDGHRSNDDMPYVFVTEDFGKTWTSLKNNLPDWAGSVRVVREDIKNENILYLGCEFGAWVSIDRGKSWTKFANVPTVSVHEFAQHPTLDDIVIATHGRSLWVADVSTLRQVNADKISQDAVLYQPRDVIVWQSGQRRGSSGTRKFVGENPDSNASLSYSLSKNVRSLEIQIVDLEGNVVKRFEDPSRSKGLHTIAWDLRRSAGSNNRGRFGPRVANGKYLVEMRVEGQRFSSILNVKPDPNRGVSSLTAESDSESNWWWELGGQQD